MKAVVALAANYDYLAPAETTLKSIFLHTPQAEVYLLNRDIPQEWFLAVQHKLTPVGGQLHDLKVDPDQFTMGRIAYKHINQYSYLKIYLPELIEADRILYLDSDVIVNHDLTPFLHYPLPAGKSLAATPDIADGNYNSGVLLIDRAAWQANRCTERCIAALNDHGDQLANGDQSLITEVVGDAIEPLSTTYNSQVGFEWVAFASNWSNFEKTLAPDPLISHYLTADKPWNLTSSGRERQRWWTYRLLEWGELQRRVLNRAQPQPQLRVFVFANTDSLTGIEALVTHLPTVEFHIAAWVEMSFKLKRLAQYPNVRLWSVVVRRRLDWLIESCAVMLDLDEFRNDEVLAWFHQTGKPIVGLAPAKAPTRALGDLNALLAYLQDLKGAQHGKRHETNG